MTTLGFLRRREQEPPVENAQQRAERLETGAAMLAVGDADIAAGRVISDDLDAWLDDWVEGRDVPLPEGSSSASPRP